jgi:hypothetical protein
MRKAIVKLSFKSLVLGILIGSLWFFYNRHGFSQTALPPRIIVAEQPNSPLLILATYVDSSDPLQPRYGYSITNNSDRAIRAYAIQERVSIDAGAPIVSTVWTNSPAMKLFLKPHESRQEDGGRGRAYQSPPVKVELAVDFVEFADSARWGDDAGKYGEILDGERAGGKAAMKKYREILANRGINGLEQELANSNSIQPETPKSGDWSNGFNMGVNMVKRRIKEAQTKGGQNEVKSELDKPFDSTEGRQDP